MHPHISYEVAMARVAEFQRIAEERSRVMAVREPESRFVVAHGLPRSFRRAGKADVARLHRVA